jgi:hypothetical protein
MAARDTVCVFGAGAPRLFAETINGYEPAATLDGTVTDTVTVVGDPAVGITDPDGEKLHVIPEAGALQVKSTSALNVPTAPTWIVNCEVAPGVTLNPDGVAVLNVKSDTLTVAGVWR